MDARAKRPPSRSCARTAPSLPPLPPASPLSTDSVSTATAPAVVSASCDTDARSANCTGEFLPRPATGLPPRLRKDASDEALNSSGVRAAENPKRARTGRRCHCEGRRLRSGCASSVPERASASASRNGNGNGRSGA
eukprot:6119020-Pleurochrysis_carterae.AAC.1